MQVLSRECPRVLGMNPGIPVKETKGMFYRVMPTISSFPANRTSKKRFNPPFVWGLRWHTRKCVLKLCIRSKQIDGTGILDKNSMFTNDQGCGIKGFIPTFVISSGIFFYYMGVESLGSPFCCIRVVLSHSPGIRRLFRLRLGKLARAFRMIILSGEREPFSRAFGLAVG